MKIILMCSSIEPGRDGVGDYSRLLAVALQRQGHKCALLALNDKFVTHVETTVQQVDETTISVIRIPQNELKGEINKIRLWIKDFDPDLLSLQFVIFGYHNKGLPFFLSKRLTTISRGYNWHIMFHELWLGMAVQESTKLKLWGRVQKHLIKTLIRRLNPKAITTQNPLYIAQLKKMGYTAGLLPLFSNIPIKDGVKPDEDNKCIRLAVFGTIHSGAIINELAADVAEYSKKNSVQVLLTFIGRCGNEAENWVNSWKNAGLEAEIMGDQPAAIVSSVLQRSTFGISSTAVAVMEKSGAFAAMRSHKLPVLNISKPWQPIGISIDVPSGVTVYQPGKFEAYIRSNPTMTYDNNNPSAVAKQMLALF